MNKISRRNAYFSGQPAGWVYLPGSALSWYPIPGRSLAAKPLSVVKIEGPILRLGHGKTAGDIEENPKETPRAYIFIHKIPMP